MPSAPKPTGSRKRARPAKRLSAVIAPLRAAYELSKAKRDCLERGMPTKKAVAWYADGRLTYDFGEPPRGKRAVHCLVCSSAAGWEIWEHERVSHALLNDENVEFCDGFTIVPKEHSCFDPEENECVWFGTREPGQQVKELLDFAARMEARLDSLEKQCEELRHEKGCRLPAIVQQELGYLVQTGRKHFTALKLGLGLQSVDELDICTAFVQGVRIERVLSRLDAIVANSPFLRVAAQQGASGQRLSKFWEWVVCRFPTGRAKEIFFGLDGLPDPENPNAMMQIEGLDLLRSDGSRMTLKSFNEKLSKYRARLKA